MERRIIAGNWKMNPKTLKEALDLAEGIDRSLADLSLERVIFPPFVFLTEVLKVVKNLDVGAQNVFYEDAGAFTGEISPAMLADIGVKWVIIGHSERRNIMMENEDMILKKVKKALEWGFKVILCVGESLHDRELNRHRDVVKRQIEGLPDHENLIIAYEPVWAIGTGRNARPDQIEEMHTLIKELTGRKVLYGGSVNSDNSKELSKVKNVDGFLVGGASLKVESFYQIAKSLLDFHP